VYVDARHRLVREALRRTEVGELDSTVIRNKHIGTLDVAVSDAVAVEVF
jgi:hypothetical protein